MKEIDGKKGCQKKEEEKIACHPEHHESINSFIRKAAAKSGGPCMTITYHLSDNLVQLSGTLFSTGSSYPPPQFDDRCP